jgi:hypothetical protein
VDPRISSRESSFVKELTFKEAAMPALARKPVKKAPLVFSSFKDLVDNKTHLQLKATLMPKAKKAGARCEICGCVLNSHNKTSKCSVHKGNPADVEIPKES